MSSEEELRQLDVRVAKEIFGSNVVGECTAIYVDGEWSLHPDSATDGWACHASKEPVYVEPLRCRGTHPEPDRSRYILPGELEAESVEYYEEKLKQHQWELSQFQGHTSRCLSVVPFYTTEDRDWMSIVEHLMSKAHFSLSTIHEGKSGGNWYAQFLTPTNSYLSDVVGHPGVGESAGEAVCRAALSDSFLAYLKKINP